MREVKVSRREKTRMMTFDDETTTVTALTDATAAMGFSSAPKE